MSTDIKTIIVTRQTRYQALIAQYNTAEQAAFVINSRGSDFDDYRIEHETYMQAVTRVEAELKRSARVQRLDRMFLPNFLFGPQDIIVVVGQDGLVANTLKYLNGQPVIAINPDPSRFDGVLLPFSIEDTAAIFSDVAAEKFHGKEITMAKATLNDGQELIAVNDLFIGPRYQISARYDISIDGESETQSSSGIIISTGLGSTGWIKSLFAGAAGILDRKIKQDNALAWNSDKLLFAVREPFPSQTTKTDIVYGDISKKTDMNVSSLMAENGVIFSDGMVDDFIDFNSGAIVNVKLAETKGLLVM